MTVPRPVPPPFRPPDCPMCGTETTPYPDEFVCDSCRASWPASGDPDQSGEWNDPTAEQCATTVQPHLDNAWITDPGLKQRTYRCVLHAGHADDQDPAIHANPDMGSWAKGWR